MTVGWYAVSKETCTQEQNCSTLIASGVFPLKMKGINHVECEITGYGDPGVSTADEDSIQDDHRSLTVDGACRNRNYDKTTAGLNRGNDYNL